jgi:hypothetical protein
LWNHDRKAHRPFPTIKKIRKNRQILRNVKADIALRSREYYSFSDRRYTSTVACASAAPCKEKFPAAVKNAAKIQQINIVDTS